MQEVSLRCTNNQMVMTISENTNGRLRVKLESSGLSCECSDILLSPKSVIDTLSEIAEQSTGFSESKCVFCQDQRLELAFTHNGWHRITCQYMFINDHREDYDFNYFRIEGSIHFDPPEFEYALKKATLIK